MVQQRLNINCKFGLTVEDKYRDTYRQAFRYADRWMEYEDSVGNYVTAKYAMCIGAIILAAKRISVDGWDLRRFYNTYRVPLTEENFVYGEVLQCACWYITQVTAGQIEALPIRDLQEIVARFELTL